MTRSAFLRDLALLTAVFALACAWSLHRPVSAHGEAREGLVVHDVVDHGHWVLPRRNGSLPSKPPLYHWIAAGLAHVVGLSDVTLRLPSALAAWGMLAVTFALGVRAGGRTTGWLAAGALAGTAPFWASAGQARIDMLFSACLVVAFAALLVWTTGGSRIVRPALYTATVLAVLAKGPAGAVLVVLVALAFVLVERRPGRLRELWSWPLALASIAVVVGWYVAAWLDGGSEFLAKQLLQENVHRFVGSGDFGHARRAHPFLMQATLVTHLLPWNLVLVAAAVRRWRGLREDAVGRFLHVWWIVVLLFFTVAAGKRAIYLLPLYPAIALLAARWLGAAMLPWPARRVAVVAVLVALLDLGLMVGVRLARDHRAARRSLVPFIDRVAALVPAATRLHGGRSLGPTDVQVLAYRLRRPLTVERPCSADGYWLLAESETPAGAVVLARSARRGEQVVLARCGASGAGL